MKTSAAVVIITGKVKSKSRKNPHLHPWEKCMIFMRPREKGGREGEDKEKEEV